MLFSAVEVIFEFCFRFFRLGVVPKCYMNDFEHVSTKTLDLYIGESSQAKDFKVLTLTPLDSTVIYNK